MSKEKENEAINETTSISPDVLRDFENDLAQDAYDYEKMLYRKKAIVIDTVTNIVSVRSYPIERAGEYIAKHVRYGTVMTTFDFENACGKNGRFIPKVFFDTLEKRLMKLKGSEIMAKAKELEEWSLATNINN